MFAMPCLTLVKYISVLFSPYYRLYVVGKGKSYKGASIYDVRAEGGGGVSPKEDVVREVA